MVEFEVQELTPAFGALITGLDPHAALDDPNACTRLQDLFDTRSVLVFRDLDIDTDTQANLARMLIRHPGLEPGESASGRPDGAPFFVSNKEDNGGAPFGRLLWHSDMMWSDHTFQVLSLYGIEVEPPVTPTLFASGVEAWRTLPAELRARAENLCAVQGHNEQERERAGGDPDVLVSTFENAQTRTTKIGHTHPRTGATVLYVSQQMTREIDGLDPDASEALLDDLFDHLYREDAIYAHEWRVNDFVAWDNIAIQHARPNVTIEGPTRTLRKVFAPMPPRSAKPPPPKFAKAG